jgi:hypothetical protein
MHGRFDVFVAVVWGSFRRFSAPSLLQRGTVEGVLELL